MVSHGCWPACRGLPATPAFFMRGAIDARLVDGEALPALEGAVEQCRSRIDEHWGDVDTDDDEAVKESSPLWHLVLAFGGSGREDVARLRLTCLAFFAARRALTCWGLSCDGDGPRRAVEAVSRSLDGGGADAPWDDLSVV